MRELAHRKQWERVAIKMGTGETYLIPPTPLASHAVPMNLLLTVRPVA